jgi:hypothetical protein
MESSTLFTKRELSVLKEENFSCLEAGGGGANGWALDWSTGGGI